MSFNELTNGVVVKMMTRVSDSNQLVITERDGRENGETTKRIKPIVWFNSGNWKTIPEKVISQFKPYGYYLVAVPWTIRGQQIIDGQRRNGGNCHVLHCVRKEHPHSKFGGKVGPMSSFAPRVNDRGILIRGYYVGYHWNGEESVEEIPNHFAGKLTLKGRKPINPNNISTSVRRLGVIVGKDGYCVGMEVRLSRGEESQKRRSGEYHHTRPIILGNGFYVFDGVHKWQPIHSNLVNPIALPTDIESPLIFLGEGIHLITSTKDMENIPNGETYRRNVEICASNESEHIPIVDWALFETDFLK